MWISGKDFLSIIWMFFNYNFMILPNLLVKQLPNCTFCTAKYGTWFYKGGSVDLSLL